MDDPLAEVRHEWESAAAAMAASRFAEGAQRYEQVIALLHGVLERAGDNTIIDWVRTNLANAHSDMGVCLLHVDGTKINRGSRALLRARLYGNSDEPVFRNLLYCIDTANSFASLVAMRSPAGASAEFVRLHNSGIDLLRKPWPPRTAGRNWEASANVFRRALALVPESAPTHYGLGLAMGGMRSEADAVKAWTEALAQDSNYNFEHQVVFDDALMGRVSAT